MIGFAGDEDQISPIDSGFFYGCPRYELMFGTRAIYDRLGNFGACSQINVKLHAGHGVYNSTSAQGIFRIGKACCFFKSIFCGDCTTSYTTDSIPAACSVNTSSLSIPLTEPLRIEPNPGSGIFTLISNTPVGTPLLVCNMQGKLVYSTILNSSRGQFDISHLNAGVYLVSANKQRTHLILVK
jgi:hypothetical protein